MTAVYKVTTSQDDYRTPLQRSKRRVDAMYLCSLQKFEPHIIHMHLPNMNADHHVHLRARP